MGLAIKPPSVREVAAQSADGGRESLVVSEVSDHGEFLSPTRFAGAPSQRGPLGYCVRAVRWVRSQRWSQSRASAAA